jgi:putative NIF3 family GTP cyclohydrolase 1 type 2
MEAKILYERLENDFINSKMSDDWAQYMDKISEYLSEIFKKRSMGLVCDFTKEVNKVYTAVFPSKKVMEKILNDNIKDAMLFVHHPSIWDIRKTPEVFYQMDKELLEHFKERRISIYNLHVPLDNFSEYSTSVTLAKALEINLEKSFAPYFGSMCGVFGKTNIKTINELKEKFQEIVGHKVSLYNYGEEIIKDNKVAIIAGGGNEIDSLKEILDFRVNTFITGITAKSEHSKKAHEFAKDNKINILGGTHYSTEKFACISMVDYFKKLELESEFIPEKPILEDL